MPFFKRQNKIRSKIYPRIITSNDKIKIKGTEQDPIIDND